MERARNDRVESSCLGCLPPVKSTETSLDSAIYILPNPLFIAGPGPYIFAFWISPQGKLFTSKVTNRNFEPCTCMGFWGCCSIRCSNSFAVAVYVRGDWHLALLPYRWTPPTNTRPGIYYVWLRGNGWNWTIPVLLYELPYLRSLDKGDANLSIATGGTDQAVRVYIAWDNRPRKQVLLAQSANGGKNWEQPAIIAGPAPDSGLAGPFNIHVGANKDNAVLVWQSGRPDGACTQFFQSSGNGGGTWSDPQPMLEGVSECPNSNEIVTGVVNNPRVPPQLYLLTETPTQVFLTAWNGLQWRSLRYNRFYRDLKILRFTNRLSTVATRPLCQVSDCTSSVATRGMVAMSGSLPASWCQIHRGIRRRYGASLHPLPMRTLKWKPLSWWPRMTVNPRFF